MKDANQKWKDIFVLNDLSFETLNEDIPVTIIKNVLKYPDQVREFLDNGYWWENTFDGDCSRPGKSFEFGSDIDAYFDPLVEDFMEFYDAEDIIRMLLMFGIFGGCYIAEVLRGGLQAVDSGQKEAAMALGLSPIQTKMTVELPNAVRTTLPSIVSVFIGLWKDTTLLFIVNILDFFKLAKDLPNTDLRFLGDFLEPLYVTAIVFWVFAFYLSRLSMGIEKNLGLVKEGGGEMA